jgi:hypothetical protein
MNIEVNPSYYYRRSNIVILIQFCKFHNGEMPVITCKECKESIYFTPHAFWSITDFGAKCEKCETINTITLENEI